MYYHGNEEKNKKIGWRGWQREYKKGNKPASAPNEKVRFGEKEEREEQTTSSSSVWSKSSQLVINNIN